MSELNDRQGERGVYVRSGLDACMSGVVVCLLCVALFAVIYWVAPRADVEGGVVVGLTVGVIAGSLVARPDHVRGGVERLLGGMATCFLCASMFVAAYAGIYTQNPQSEWFLQPARMGDVLMGGAFIGLAVGAVAGSLFACPRRGLR